MTSCLRTNQQLRQPEAGIHIEMLNFGAQMSAVQPEHTHSSLPTMRLRDEPQPTVSQPTSSRNSRKRKSPPDTNNQDPQIQQQIAQPPAIQHVLPSALMHTMSTVGFQYSPQDFTTGIPPGVTDQAESPPAEAQTGSGGRALSTSKRAEQNRKAQRAFRERRDQYVFLF